jgi:NTP pyrophosphatase (non-canonical NTP hydrolase)
VPDTTQPGHLERIIKILVAKNARHVRKGTVLGQETWLDVIEHLKEEVREFEDAMQPRYYAPIGEQHRHRIEELGDILGIVVHAAVKLGVSMAEVEAAEIEKLSQRFTVPDQVSKREQVDCGKAPIL